MKCIICGKIFFCKRESEVICNLGCDICVCNNCYKGTTVKCINTFQKEDKKIIGGYKVIQNR